MNKHGKCKFEDNKKTFTMFTSDGRRGSGVGGGGLSWQIEHSSAGVLSASTPTRPSLGGMCVLE